RRVPRAVVVSRLRRRPGRAATDIGRPGRRFSDGRRQERDGMVSEPAFLPADALAEFERDQRRRGLSVRTIKHRSRVVRTFGRWLAPKALVDAEPADLDDWLDSCDLHSPRSQAAYIGV